MAALDQHLSEKFGGAKLLSAWSLPNIHLDYAQIDKSGLKREDVETAAARYLLAQNGIVEAYTRTQLENGAANTTRIATLMRRAWNREASGDLMVVTKPYWYFGTGTSGTSHGSPYAYDTNVPLMIMGTALDQAGRLRPVRGSGRHRADAGQSASRAPAGRRRGPGADRDAALI